MKTVRESHVNLMFSLKWENDGITHHEKYYAGEVNLWRDIFSETVLESLLNKPEGSISKMTFRPGELHPEYSDNLVRPGNRNRIDIDRIPGNRLGLGRFYPKGLLKGMPGIFRENMFPFRCVGIDGDQWIADLNHLLSMYTLELSAQVLNILEKRKERGGSCTDWIELLLSGPGMQSRYRGTRTDFFGDNPFERDDAEPDKLFYARERLVSHVDEHAGKTIADIYGEKAHKDSVVLDLLASWDSHLPENLSLKEVHGLGLNERELEANEKLASFALQDINEKPDLPFSDMTFDDVICSLSVEYLITPMDIFREVARILKPGGNFIVTFSNRSFPPKAIKLWNELHEFERMGLVLDYFLAEDLFENIGTFSQRGFPRPLSDKYYRQYLYSDPVYCVWGSKKRT